MIDATINPVSPYDPVPRLPDGGGRGRRDSPGGRQPSASRPSSGSAPAATPETQPAQAPDPDATRGRHIDDRA